MRCVVIGGGAWGLPAAAELARRGHPTTLLDRYGIGNRLSSSSGPTRLWRLIDTDPLLVRLARRALEAMQRLEELTGATVFLRRGLLWRTEAETAAAAMTVLDREGVPYTAAAAADVGRFFPGLHPDGRDALWMEDAGPVLAAASLQAQLALFERSGGTLHTGTAARGVERTARGLRVDLADGTTLHADAVVVAPGPGAVELLPALGVHVTLQPQLEQVVHFGDPGVPHRYDVLPCLIDGRTPCHGGIYAMPTPGTGFKAGLDVPLRDLKSGDNDRTPDPARTRDIEDWIQQAIPGIPPQAIDAQVCSWTASPDRRFIIDAIGDSLVVACGDSGTGFKFSALMGTVLADLAEGRAPDADVAAFSVRRFQQQAALSPTAAEEG